MRERAPISRRSLRCPDWQDVPRVRAERIGGAIAAKGAPPLPR